LSCQLNHKICPYSAIFWVLLLASGCGSGLSTGAVAPVVSGGGVASSEPTLLAWASGSGVPVFGGCAAYTVEATRANGVATNVATATPVVVSGLGQGALYLDAACTQILSGNTVTIAAGTSATTVYFSDSLDATPMALTFSAQAVGFSSALIEVTLKSPLITQISSQSGGSSVCALSSVSSGGGVFCWGANTNGMLGNGGAANSYLPVAVLAGAQGSGNLSNITSVTVGNDFACALTVSSEVFCWGTNGSGSLGNGGVPINSSTAVQVLGGAQGSGKLFAVSAIAGGTDFACALSSENVFCWGLNVDGELGNNSTALSGIPVQVLAGAQSGVAGAKLTDITAISLGENQACGAEVQSGGLAFCWGSNVSGQLGDNATAAAGPSTPVLVQDVGGGGDLSGIIAVAAGGRHTCALRSSSGVYCWGDGSLGQLGNNNTLESNSPVAVLGVGGVGFLTGVSSIAAGDSHTCAIANSDGTNLDVVYCWGDGLDGDLGNNATIQANVPVEVVGVGGVGVLSGILSITAGAGHTCALSSVGAVYCWGSNTQGALGASAPGAQSSVPVPVAW
jgi:alpha-tubulin suppressor-like RCC1 family protein